MNETDSTVEFHQVIRGADGAIEGVLKPRAPRLDLELVGEAAAQARKAYDEGRAQGEAQGQADGVAMVEAAAQTEAARVADEAAQAAAQEIHRAALEQGFRLGWAARREWAERAHRPAAEPADFDELQERVAALKRGEDTESTR